MAIYGNPIPSSVVRFFAGASDGHDGHYCSMVSGFNWLSNLLSCQLLVMCLLFEVT